MTRDHELVRFLQWALPRIGHRWRGYRNVRRQVGRRLRQRLVELGLTDLDAYRRRLRADPAEWEVLDRCCRISISRFLRDRRVFDALQAEVLPELAASSGSVRVWSAGCARGEEPYSVVLIGSLARPRIEVEVAATDADELMLERARVATYRSSSLSELPRSWVERAFVREGEGELRLKPEHRDPVRFLLQDLRTDAPGGPPFQLVLCRNLTLTYHDHAVQVTVLERIHRRLAPEGVLVVGSHERLPQGAAGFEPLGAGKLPLYRRQ